MNKNLLLSIVLLTSLLFTSSMCDKDDEESDSRISATGSVYDITNKSATITCKANINRDLLPVVSLGVEYSENSDMTHAYHITSSSLGTDNSYTVKLTYLDPNTTYYYRSYVKYISSDMYEYGQIKSFTTDSDFEPQKKFKVTYKPDWPYFAITINLSLDSSYSGHDLVMGYDYYYGTNAVDLYDEMYGKPWNLNGSLIVNKTYSFFAVTDCVVYDIFVNSINNLKAKSSLTTDEKKLLNSLIEKCKNLYASKFYVRYWLKIDGEKYYLCDKITAAMIKGNTPWLWE